VQKKTKCGTCTQSNTCWPDGHRYTKRTILTASIIFYLYPDSNRQCHRCGKGKKRQKKQQKNYVKIPESQHEHKNNRWPVQRSTMCQPQKISPKNEHNAVSYK
jgi:hypothetical protein